MAMIPPHQIPDGAATIPGMAHALPVRIPEFSFSSPLAAHAVELERLRGDLPQDLTNLPVVTELGHLRRLMASIISARIEGNRTAVLAAVEGARTQETTPDATPSSDLLEILNLQDASEFVDDHVATGTPLTHGFVRELHRLATSGVETSPHHTPGEYRAVEVGIQRSSHRPPLASTVHAEMTALLDFANEPAPAQFQLLNMAVAHHRFVWIHPFSDGNGRTARLFSYAMIRSYGFAPEVAYPTINPTTVFGADRQGYYDNLAAADTLLDEGLTRWCEFVLRGILADMQAVRTLVDPDALGTLLRSAISRATRAAQLDDREAAALTAVAHGRTFQAGNLAPAVGLDPSGRSQLIRGLTERGLITRSGDAKRKYHIRLSPNALTPFVLAELGDRGLLPAILED